MKEKEKAPGHSETSKPSSPSAKAVPHLTVVSQLPYVPLDPNLLLGENEGDSAKPSTPVVDPSKLVTVTTPGVGIDLGGGIDLLDQIFTEENLKTAIHPAASPSASSSPKDLSLDWLFQKSAVDKTVADPAATSLVPVSKAAEKPMKPTASPTTSAPKDSAPAAKEKAISPATIVHPQSLTPIDLFFEPTPPSPPVKPAAALPAKALTPAPPAAPAAAPVASTDLLFAETIQDEPVLLKKPIAPDSEVRAGSTNVDDANRLNIGSPQNTGKDDANSLLSPGNVRQTLMFGNQSILNAVEQWTRQQPAVPEEEAAALASESPQSTAPEVPRILTPPAAPTPAPAAPKPQLEILPDLEVELEQEPTPAKAPPLQIQENIAPLRIAPSLGPTAIGDPLSLLGKTLTDADFPSLPASFMVDEPEPAASPEKPKFALEIVEQEEDASSNSPAVPTEATPAEATPAAQATLPLDVLPTPMPASDLPLPPPPEAALPLAANVAVPDLPNLAFPPLPDLPVLPAEAIVAPAPAAPTPPTQPTTPAAPTTPASPFLMAEGFMENEGDMFKTLVVDDTAPLPVRRTPNFQSLLDEASADEFTPLTETSPSPPEGPWATAADPDLPPPVAKAPTGMEQPAVALPTGATPATPVPGIAEIALPSQPLRTTVLPTVQIAQGAPQLVIDNKNRYEARKELGSGASGDVEMVLDNDIHRFVAIKRLKKDQHNPGPLVRFVEEIRTVGSLEHPNIVPIHDVGVDENGRYYFVMKYIQGETLESVIEKLRAGNPHYHKKFTFDYRVQVVTEILKALEFAHAHGVIHRDLKPANIMLGRYGEVVVMDWGIAKQIRQEADPSKGAVYEALASQPTPSDEHLPPRERIFRTRNDALIGTPAYMSPEQVLGENDKIDERSDMYSLSVLFYEFMTLQHYLGHKDTLEAVYYGVIHEPPKHAMLVSNPHQHRVPVELGHLLVKALKKKPEERFQSAAELRERLQNIHEGFIPVQCPFTFTKRVTHALLHLINNHPVIGLTVAILLLVLFFGGGFSLAYYLPRLWGA